MPSAVDVGEIAVRRGKQRELWTEEEELDAALAVEAAYLGEHGEGRVVYHDAAFRVLAEVLVVSAGEEGAHNLASVQLGDGTHEFEHGIVDGFRSVAVVGSEFLLELFDEGVVVLVSLLALSAEALFLHFLLNGVFG